MRSADGARSTSIMERAIFVPRLSRQGCVLRFFRSLLGLGLLLASGLEAQQTSRTEPVTGLRSNSTGYHALVGARVVTAPGQVIDNGTDPYPYLRSVKYPFADPSTWEREWTLPEIESSLRGAGVAVPSKIERITVAERGVSPRVLRVQIHGAGATDEVRGTTFADALELPSTWFDVGTDRGVARSSAITFLSGDLLSETTDAPPRSGGPWGALVTMLFAGALLTGAVRLRRQEAA